MKYYLKAGALVLISLVISLIINSAVVMAGLSNPRVHGIDNVNGYLRKTDNGQVEVHAEIAGDGDITPNQVKLSGEYDFTSCTSINGKFNCIYDFSFTNSKAKRYDVDISLYDDSKAKIDQKSTSFVIDNEEPTGSFEVKEKKGKNLTLKIDAHDKACDDSSCSGKCSAINNIDVTVDSVLAETITPEIITCDYSTEVELSIDVEGTETKDICIDLYDRVGNQNLGQDCKYITIDGTVPSLTLMQITDLAYQPIQYITPAQREVYVEATISEDTALNTGSVYADLSELNDFPGIKQGYKEIKTTTCNKRGADWMCYFKITMQVSQGGTKNVRVWAYDESNNLMNQTYSLNLQMDNSDPVATGIRSDFIDEDGKSWVGKENNAVYADITETGAGLSKANVFMNLAALMGIGYGKVKASSCEPSWTCSWFMVKVENAKTNDVLPVSLTYPSQDDAGNLLQGISGDLYYDGDKPEITSIELFAVGGPEYEAPGTYKTGDLLFVVVNMTELGSGVKNAYADFSNLYPRGENTSADKCEKTKEEKWSCQWTTKAIAGNHRKTSVSFDVIDLVGNVGTREKEIEILGVSEKPVSFWDSSGFECSPENVDATLAAYAPDGLSLYCSFSLTASSNVRAVYVEPIGCEGADETSDEFIDSSESTLYDYEITTPKESPLEMYAKIVINQYEIPADVNKLKTNCSLMIVSAYQDKVYPPETVDVYMDFDVINSDLSLSKNVREEIAILKDQLRGGLWPLIGTLNRVVSFSRITCQVIGSLFVAFQAFNIVSGPVGEVLKDTVIFIPVGIAVNVADVALTEFAEGSWRFAKTFCNIVSCRLTPVDALGGTWASSYETAIDVWVESTEGRFGDLDLSLGSVSKPEDSIVFSTLTLCIPGMIYNLEKYRQIDCMYIDCVENWVPAGTSITECQRMRYANRCQYVFGQIFQVVPFSRVFDDLGGLAQAILTDPVTLVGLGAGIYCWKFAGEPQPSSSTALTACNAIRLTTSIIDVTADLTTSFRSWKGDKDICKDVLAEKEGEEGGEEHEP